MRSRWAGSSTWPDAKRAVEWWARSYDPGIWRGVRRRAARSRKAPPYLLARAARMKIEGAERMTAARVQEEIDRAQASACLDYLA
jgi:hypothetical protein